MAEIVENFTHYIAKPGHWPEIPDDGNTYVYELNFPLTRTRRFYATFEDAAYGAIELAKKGPDYPNEGWVDRVRQYRDEKVMRDGITRIWRANRDGVERQPEIIEWRILKATRP